MKIYYSSAFSRHALDHALFGQRNLTMSFNIFPNSRRYLQTKKNVLCERRVCPAVSGLLLLLFFGQFLSNSVREIFIESRRVFPNLNNVYP
jgi:hypothetical protein